MNDFARARPDLKVNDEVSVTLPAIVWVSFVSSYIDAEWNSSAANAVVNAAQHAYLDPVWIKEREAANQAQQSRVMPMFGIPLASLFGNPDEQVPPDASGLTGDEPQ